MLRESTPLIASLATVLLLALAAPAAAQADATVQLRVEAHDGGGLWFETDATGDERNPTIQLPAGATVHLTFVNAGDATHTLDFGDPIGESTGRVGPGDQATLEFTVPGDASGTGEYWCQPHRGAGMAGVVEFTAANAPGGNGADGDANPDTTNESPGFGVAAALVAAAGALLAARRRR